MPPEEKGNGLPSTGPVQPQSPTSEPEMISVPAHVLTKMQEDMADLARKVTDTDAKNAALEEMVSEAVGADPVGQRKLRETKDFEPKFRTVRLRKFPIAGDVNNMGIVIGWTSRGAYQQVDRTGVNPQVIDFIEVIFLDHERDADGKLQAEKIKLLDLMNAPQVHCKIIETDKTPRKEPTGEEISVSTFDPNHGMTSNGEIVDGFTGFLDITYTVEVPGRDEPVVINGLFVN